MAFGLPASFQTEHDLLGSRQTARDAIVYAFELVGWNYVMIDVDHFRAKVPPNHSSWGEIVTVSLDTPGYLQIKSHCRSPIQFFDWGKNRRNVDQFLTYFSHK